MGVLRAKGAGALRQTARGAGLQGASRAGQSGLHTTLSITLEPGGGAEGFKGGALRVRLAFGENSSG